MYMAAFKYLQGRIHARDLGTDLVLRSMTKAIVMYNQEQSQLSIATWTLMAIKYLKQPVHMANGGPEWPRPVGYFREDLQATPVFQAAGQYEEGTGIQKDYYDLVWNLLASPRMDSRVEAF